MKNKLLLIGLFVLAGMGSNAVGAQDSAPKEAVLRRYGQFNRTAKAVAGIDMTTSPQEACKKFQPNNQKVQACRQSVQQQKNDRITAYRKSCTQLRNLKIRKVTNDAYEDAPNRAPRARNIATQVQQNILVPMIANCDDHASKDLNGTNAAAKSQMLERVMRYHMEKAVEARLELTDLP